MRFSSFETWHLLVPKRALHVDNAAEMKIFKKTVHALGPCLAPENVWTRLDKWCGRTKAQTVTEFCYNNNYSYFLLLCWSHGASNQNSVNIFLKKSNCARIRYFFGRLSKENSGNNLRAEIEAPNRYWIWKMHRAMIAPGRNSFPDNQLECTINSESNSKCSPRLSWRTIWYRYCSAAQ